METFEVHWQTGFNRENTVLAGLAVATTRSSGGGLFYVNQLTRRLIPPPAKA